RARRRAQRGHQESQASRRPDRGRSGLLRNCPWRRDVRFAAHRLRFQEQWHVPGRQGRRAYCRRAGQTLTLQEMLMFFLINDMIVPGSTYWNMVFGRMPGEALNDEEGVATI